MDVIIFHGVTVISSGCYHFCVQGMLSFLRVEDVIIFHGAQRANKNMTGRIKNRLYSGTRRLRKVLKPVLNLLESWLQLLIKTFS